MKRFKKKLKVRKVKAKKDKTHSQRWYREQELKEWELKQIELGIKEKKRRKKKGIKVRWHPSIDHDGICKWKLKRFKSKDGDTLFQPSLPKEHRAKRLRMSNGDFTIEDLVFNPLGPPHLDRKTNTWNEDLKWKYNAAKKILDIFGVKRKWYTEYGSVEKTKSTWTQVQTDKLRRAFRLLKSRKKDKQKLGRKIFSKLESSYTDEEFTRASYAIKETNGEFPFCKTLTLRTWGELNSDPKLKQYGIKIPMPQIIRK